MDAKEEILKKHIGYHFENRNHDMYYRAMDEWAKLEAIAFNTFVWNGYKEVLHGLKITPLYVTKEDFYKLENPALGKQYTQEELYNEYLKSKT